MRRRFYSSNLFLTFIFFLVVGNVVKGQDLGFDSFLRAGSTESQKLIGLYLEPLVAGGSYNMSNGWYHTAKTHEKPFELDLSVTANFTLIPDSRRYFIFDEEDYNYVLMDGQDNRIPTAMASSDEGGALLNFRYYDELSGEIISGSYIPKGLGMEDKIGVNAVLSPIIQLDLGTFRNTDIIVRYVPTYKFGDFSTSLFGIGVKHGLTQWMPFLENAPVDVAILGAFSGSDNNCDLTGSEFEGDDQIVSFNINSWTLQLLTSADISIVTFYTGLGYNSINSSIKMTGSYIIEDELNPDLTFTLQNPVNTGYDEGSWRATGGLKLKFGFFSWYIDYTLQKYQTVSSGFGFSMR